MRIQIHNTTLPWPVAVGNLSNSMSLENSYEKKDNYVSRPESSVVDPKLFFYDPDTTFQEISDPAPDPTQFLSKEAKAKF